MHSTLSPSRLRARWFVAAVCGALLAIVPKEVASAAGCADLPSQGDGIVAAVVDARSLRLHDGREVKLAGIELVPERRDHAIAALSALLIGRRVKLHAADDMPDRYGRQPAFVFPEAGESPAQAMLLGAGDALVGIGVAPSACRAELLAAERAAQYAAKGAWATGNVIKNAANSGDILSRAGQFTVVEGVVASVREAGATVFLNFDRRWTNAFAVTISRRIVGSFEAAGIAPKSLIKKRIRVRGWVERRTGPSIAVRDVGQIEPEGGDQGRK